MGSHLSCIYVTASSVADNGSSPSPAVKIVLASDGRTCELQEPMKVAELMLEFPNHFVAEYDHESHRPSSSSCGKRVSPLPADHDTKLCHVYILLPMRRLNTRLSAEELDLISRLASTSACTRAPSAVHTSKVTPISAHGHCEGAHSIAKSFSVPILELVGEDISAGNDATQPETQHDQVHVLRSKSWTPKLETIIESSQLLSF